MLPKPTKLRDDQRGLASILVTLVIMLIISLIVVGFARLSRREQRQSLDDQLSTQAFYAAESGVNDTLQEIKSGGYKPATDATDYSSDCSAFINKLKTDTSNSTINVLNASAGVQYTCLLTNRAPGSLTYNDIRTDRSTVALVKPLSGTIDTITISWQNLAPNTLTDTFCNTDPGVFPFPTNNQWSNSPYNCDVGIIRADILPGTAFNRAALNCNAMTAFLYPISTPPATPLSYHDCNFTPPASGAITSGACDLTHTPYCSVKISFPAENQVYLRLKSIYLDSSVSITACSSPCSSNASLTGDQLLVDATGKANDVLRRIQVRVPISPSGPFPEFALLSGDSICKRLQIDPTTGTATNAGPPGIEACNVLNP